MADVTNLRSPAEAGLSKLFESARKGFASEQAISREEAFRFFEATGLPSRRVEAFKYTDLRAAITEAAPPAEAPSEDAARAAVAGTTGFNAVEAVRLTFVNGHLVASLSDLDRVPEGVTVTPLNEAMGKGDARLKLLAPRRAGAREPDLPAQHRLPRGWCADLGRPRRQAGDADPPALRRHG
ncbi:protein of unknown function [Methylorubrum extorquens]|uniref:SUF system FeS cluster assembly SufBD N-terminal domain-containing protein n=1 Tax=Methylorubrum extorquens TaxID=408 RepID=A0A2N9AL76_METEX|nr:protein of unknown function [Methylorubrum extorquens]